jgi:hypothetical protein
VVIDGKQHLAIFAAGRADADGGLSAIAADFSARTAGRFLSRYLVKMKRLFLVKKAFGGSDEI